VQEVSGAGKSRGAQAQLQRVRSLQKLLKDIGEKPIPVGRSTPLTFEETARRDEIIKDFFKKNPGAQESADSLAKKIPVTADYIKQSINKRNLVPGIKLVQRETDIFPEVKALDKIIKENKELITSDEKVTPKINKIVKEFADATGKTFAEANSAFFARMRKLGDLYSAPETGFKPRVKIFGEIKPPINYDDNFRKHFIQLASRAAKGGLNNTQMASLLGLPEKEIKLIGQTATMMKGFGKEFQMQGDHTDIKSMMQNFDDYKNNFSRIEYIRANLNAYKGIFDKKIKNLAVEAKTASPIRQAKILEEQTALRKEFMDKTGYRIGEFGIDKGRVFIDPKTLRLPDLMNPMNETLQQAMKNLETTQVPPDYKVQTGNKPTSKGRILHTPKEVWNEFDRALMNAKTVEERLKLFEYANKNPEIAKQSKYLQVLSKAPKVGKIVKGILKGTAVVGGTMGMATLANSAELGQMPQGSPGQLSEEEKDTGIPYEAGAPTAAALGKYGPQIWKGAKAVGKGILKPVMSPAMGVGLAVDELVEDIFPIKFAEEGEKNLLGLTYDEKFGTLNKDSNVSLAGSALLWPDIMKRLGSKVTTAQNFYDKVLRMGVAPRLVPHLIKGMTGAGLIMIAGDVAYRAKKFADQLDFDRPLTEEQRTDIQERKTAVPRMFDTYEQASKIAQEQGISYEEALKQLDKPNVPGITFNQGGRAGFKYGGS